MCYPKSADKLFRYFSAKSAAACICMKEEIMLNYKSNLVKLLSTVAAVVMFYAVLFGYFALSNNFAHAAEINTQQALRYFVETDNGATLGTSCF